MKLFGWSNSDDVLVNRYRQTTKAISTIKVSKWTNSSIPCNWSQPTTKRCKWKFITLSFLWSRDKSIACIQTGTCNVVLSYTGKYNPKTIVPIHYVQHTCTSILYWYVCVYTGTYILITTSRCFEEHSAAPLLIRASFRQKAYYLWVGNR